MTATALPWYVHPAEDPAAWAALATARPWPSFVVVNVHDGPGPADDPWYPTALAGLRGHRLLGYVPLTWGARPLRQVLDDVTAWLERYDVDGVMLDEFPTQGPTETWLSAVEGARAAGARIVVGNPGVDPGRDRVEALDVTCVFEGTAAEHARYTPSADLAGVPPERLWHLVHGCPAADLDVVTARAAALGAGHVFVTDRRLPHPWGGLPLAAGASAGVQAA